MANASGPRYASAMSKRAAAIDDRQVMIPLDLPPGPRLSSDDKARNELLGIIETLEAAKSPPWSARLLGWQQRRFGALTQMLTPLDGASLKARFEAALERLGPPED